MSKLELSLVESEVKLLLEALVDKEAKMSSICAASDDEDEIAEVGNDLIELRLFLKPLREKAIDRFGSSVVNFSNELL